MEEETKNLKEQVVELAHKIDNQYDDLEVLLEKFKDFTVWLHGEIEYLSNLVDEDEEEEE